MKTFPNQKQLVHVWTSETKQTNTAEEPHMNLSGYSTRGWDGGVYTETITTVYLGQKHNLESPNQDQLTFIWHYDSRESSQERRDRDIKCNSRKVTQSARDSLRRQELPAQNISIYVAPVRNDQLHQSFDAYLKMFIDF